VDSNMRQFIKTHETLESLITNITFLAEVIKEKDMEKFSNYHIASKMYGMSLQEISKLHSEVNTILTRQEVVATVTVAVANPIELSTTFVVDDQPALTEHEVLSLVKEYLEEANIILNDGSGFSEDYLKDCTEYKVNVWGRN
jgi:hypothetical protein